MCLLVQEFANLAPASDEFLKGVYKRNSDGIGVMWAEDGKLHLHKAVLTNAQEFVEFYRAHIQGKDCCWHARMRTHGDINLINCHPYPVFGFGKEKTSHPMLLMHNGILSCGNGKDTSKSDTWHYIREFLRPILDKNPELIHTEAFLKMLESHIGSTNKFALMDHTGKAVIANRSAGVEYEGRWLSNTYAWDYYGLHPNGRKASAYSSKRYSGWDNDAYWSGFGIDKSKKATVTVPKSAVKLPIDEDSFVDDSNDKAISFAERVLDVSPNAYEALTVPMIDRIFKEFSDRDVEVWLEGLEFGKVSTQEFIAGMKDPRKVQAWLNTPDLYTQYHGG